MHSNNPLLQALAEMGQMGPMGPPMGPMGPGGPMGRDPRLPPPGTVAGEPLPTPAMGPIPGDPESLMQWLQFLQSLPPQPGRGMQPPMIGMGMGPPGPGMPGGLPPELEQMLPLLMRGAMPPR